MTTYRGVLIGCGFFANNHMNAWRDLEGASIVAVCDTDEARAGDMARRFGIDGVYADAERMLRDVAPDFVDVATTSASHRPLVELAAPHAQVMICQKPIADTLEEAQAMVAAADRAGSRLIIHENFRWQKPFRTIAELLRSGDLGDVHFARFSFRHGYDNYKNQPYLAEIERFTIMDVGLHLLDLSRSLVGEARTLACRTQRLNPIVKGEDAFTIMLGHQNGATSIVDCSFFSRLVPHRFPQTLATVEGSKGTVELGEDWVLTLHRGDRREVLNLEPEVPAWGEKPWHVIQDSVVAFQSHVIDVLRGDAEPQPSGQDNLRTFGLALAAYDAAATDTVINVADRGR